MGSDSGEKNEAPEHEVSISNFWMGETTVTRDLWQAVMGGSFYDAKESQLPKTYVDWADCQKFIQKLNELADGQLPKGFHFALPTEAEWEFAARGGNKSKGYLYSGSNKIDDVAWYWGNSGDEGVPNLEDDEEGKYHRPHPVKNKLPNELGLYDMSGNVWEWCWDRYYKYKKKPQTDPHGYYGNLSDDRVLRGGACGDGAEDCRLSRRISHSTKFSGFRLALVRTKNKNGDRSKKEKLLFKWVSMEFTDFLPFLCSPILYLPLIIASIWHFSPVLNNWWQFMLMGLAALPACFVYGCVCSIIINMFDSSDWMEQRIKNRFLKSIFLWLYSIFNMLGIGLVFILIFLPMRIGIDWLWTLSGIPIAQDWHELILLGLLLVYGAFSVLIWVIFETIILAIKRARICVNKDGDIVVKGKVLYKMVHVEGGTLQRQNDNNQDKELPVQNITVNDFSIGETVVTEALWKAVTGEPCRRGNNFPLCSYLCEEFIKKLNKRTGRVFRLPTETEWEFAARGGNKSHGYI